MANPGIAEWQEAWDINEKLYNKSDTTRFNTTTTKGLLYGTSP